MPVNPGSNPPAAPRIRIPFRERASMVLRYARGKLADQARAVAFLVLYLAAFQFLVLRRPIGNALAVALGIGAVALGLALFLEGLFLGVMPLGEKCGLRLPSRAGIAVIVAFSLVLGITATLAEPAIGFLRAQGSSVLPWETPLLYLLLNRGTSWLVTAIAVGVGIAVVLGVLRFLRGWSLRPFLYVLIPLLLGFSLWASRNPAAASVVGLAWDTGGATTGPVTVPLVIALGIGVSRIVGKGDGASGGLGVVTLASALPVLAVLGLALALAPRVPEPMGREAFFSRENRDKAVFTAGSEEALRGMAAGALQTLEYAAAFGEETPPPAGGDSPGTEAAGISPASHLGNALKSILPMALVLIVTLRLLLRERIANADELALGLAFAVAGLFLFSLGMERGLNVLGREAGRNLPKAYTASERPDRARVYRGVEESLVVRVLGKDGPREYLAVEGRSGPELLPFERERFDPAASTYTHVPVERPILADAPKWAGFAAVMAFVFVLGFGATLAEPSLNALGITLEELTVGTYKRSFLVRTVAVGVGFGMAAGFARILLDLPILAILGIPYVLALVLTAFSSDEFVGIAWDSAGVTTGPITVPLVIAAGLGIGEQSLAAESFGVVAAASVFPILSVLASGLAVKLRNRRSLNLNLDEM